MSTLCSPCIGSYCSCRFKSSPELSMHFTPQSGNNSFQPFLSSHAMDADFSVESTDICLLHSRCTYCSSPLAPAASPGSAKRKLARILAQDCAQDDLLMEFLESRKQKVLVSDISVCKNGIECDEIEILKSKISDLTNELQEERHSAALAATETLAMISRLQKENAALQREIREQNLLELHDREAIAMLEDLLFKSEEEKYSLEMELEIFKEKVNKMETLNKITTPNRDILADDSDARSSVCDESEVSSTPRQRGASGRRQSERGRLISKQLLESFYASPKEKQSTIVKEMDVADVDTPLKTPSDHSMETRSLNSQKKSSKHQKTLIYRPVKQKTEANVNETSPDGQKAVDMGASMVSKVDWLRRQTDKHLNLRIIGMLEKENERIEEVVSHFFRTFMHISEPTIVDAWRDGRKGSRSRHIVVKFEDAVERTRVLRHRHHLKGQYLYICEDLSRDQYIEKKYSRMATFR